MKEHPSKNTPIPGEIEEIEEIPSKNTVSGLGRDSEGTPLQQRYKLNDGLYDK